MMIDACVGTDVGQFLNGSQTNIGGPDCLKGNFKGRPHTHSSYAYKIMRSLVIARLEASSRPALFTAAYERRPVADDAHSAVEMYTNTEGSGSPPSESDLVFGLVKEDDMNNCVYRFTLRSDNVKVSKFYRNLDLAGLGYSVTSRRNHVN